VRGDDPRRRLELGEEDRVLAAEQVVERRHRDARALRELAHGEAGVAALGDQLARRFADAGAALGFVLVQEAHLKRVSIL